ncbi:MAG: helix-turn-helix domain-containing protein [Oscillospiraceae bacterium]|nr:helix-turn-helix domain-containing protein [Oscillospiraceae bacterium]
MSDTGFNRILTLLRKERGITQKEAARNLGISQALLSHYEKGIRECGLDFLVRVASYYEVSCDYLLGLSPDRSGLILQVADIPESDDKNDAKYRGSVLPTLNKKLIANSLNILFDLLQQVGEKQLTTEVSSFLMLSVYKMFRMLFSANPKNTQSTFSVPEPIYARYTDAEMSYIEAHITSLLSGETSGNYKTANNAGELEISTQHMGEKYPLYATSLLNLIQLAEKTIQSDDSLP